jgi:DNA-binding transcriptional regulator YiaG
MQIIKGKHYNEYEIGGFILLVPVYGKQSHMFVLGELKDLVVKLDEIGKVAHEANRQMYLEAREKYVSTQSRLAEIDNHLSTILPKSVDIEAIETRKLLAEEKRKLESDLYHLSETLDQLYHKDFVPQRANETPVSEPAPTTLERPAEPEQPSEPYEQTDGYKVRQKRNALGETQAQFARRFNVHPVHVSLWENNKEKPRKEVLEYQVPTKESQTAHPQE